MKFVSLFSRAVTILTVIALTVSLFTFISCNSFNEPQETISSPISNDNYDPGKHRAFTDDWTDAGSTHNACMDMLDDSLVYRPLSTFTSQEAAINWVTNLMADHLIDELGYDTSYVNPSRRHWLETGYVTSTLDTIQSIVSNLLAEAIISSRENTYLSRLSNFLYDPSLSKSQINDSLTSFKNDVNDISWESSEIIIVPVMSITYYSNLWLDIGPDDSNPAMELSMLVLLEDFNGAIWGSLAGPWGAAAGAVTGSGIALVMELIMDS
ncbi:hypothetical protein ES703_55841 [subsurface metagenome]